MLRSWGVDGFQLFSALSQKLLICFSFQWIMLFRQGDNHAWRSSVKPIYFRRGAAVCRGKLWVMRNCFPSSTKLTSDQITELFFWKSPEVNLGTPALLLPFTGSVRHWHVIEPDRFSAASLGNGRRQAKAGGPCKLQFCSFLTALDGQSV